MSINKLAVLLCAAALICAGLCRAEGNAEAGKRPRLDIAPGPDNTEPEPDGQQGRGVIAGLGWCAPLVAFLLALYGYAF